MKEEKRYIVKIGDCYVSRFIQDTLAKEMNRIEITKEESKAHFFDSEDIALDTAKAFCGKAFEQIVMYSNYKEIEEERC